MTTRQLRDSANARDREWELVEGPLFWTIRSRKPGGRWWIERPYVKESAAREDWKELVKDDAEAVARLR